MSVCFFLQCSFVNSYTNILYVNIVTIRGPRKLLTSQFIVFTSDVMSSEPVGNDLLYASKVGHELTIIYPSRR